MNRPTLTTSALVLLSALTAATTGAAQQYVPPVGATQEAPTVLKEEDIGLTLYRPQFAQAKMLVHYAGELSEPRLHYIFVNPANQQSELRYRDRYVLVDDSIGIQGDARSREAAAEFLMELDRFLGGETGPAGQGAGARSRITIATSDAGDGRAATDFASRMARSEPQTRTIRLKSVTLDSALLLLDAMAPTVERQVVRENGSIVLRGTVESVGRAEALLREVDRPSPQMTIHLSLVQATAEGPGDVDDELARALGGLMPGRQFREVGRFMTRASVSGATPLELSSNFAGPDGVPPPRFQFKAGSRAWDPEARALTLGRAELRVDTPLVQTTATAGPGGKAPSVTQTFGGYNTAGITTDLALLAGERTVVGTVGDHSLFVVLRVDVQ